MSKKKTVYIEGRLEIQNLRFSAPSDLIALCERVKSEALAAKDLENHTLLDESWLIEADWVIDLCYRASFQRPLTEKEKLDEERREVIRERQVEQKRLKIAQAKAFEEQKERELFEKLKQKYEGK